MISRIQAVNYRCLRYVDRRLSPFHVLVGPNASGKTTFLDVVGFLSDLLRGGLERALGNRSSNFDDLVWNRQGGRFELAIEVRIPEEKRKLLADPSFDVFRYEIAVGKDEEGVIGIQGERGLLKHGEKFISIQKELFPAPPQPPATLLSPKQVSGARSVFSKVPGGNDNFYSEAYGESGKGWVPTFKLGPLKSTLANLPADELKFPVATWLKELLTEGVQHLVLNSLLIRQASAPGQVRGFRPDGSNLPWVIDRLMKRNPERHLDWVEHLATALPDLRGIRTIEREDDKHRYLILDYEGGLQVPSWMASDGTLRLLALTLPAYLQDFSGVYLIEEPENGIHPRAVETMFSSLSSVYGAQILLATHSPVILSVAEPDSVLCFAKTDEGATDIVSGTEHPKLREWQGETNLGVLFAAGVLG